MLAGILLGLGAALLQSLSYVFSRLFISKYHNAPALSICSQIWMGALGGTVLLATLPFLRYPLSREYIFYAAAWAVTFILAQSTFFAALKTVEASRLSSLLGLKLIVLALLALLFTRENLTVLRWCAVVLCSIAAVGMNFTGGRLTRQSLCWLFLTVLFYALCDLSCTHVIQAMPGKSMLLNSVGATAVCYFCLGALTLPALFFVKLPQGCWRDTFSYSTVWFVSIIFLLAAFGSLGVIYASIIQSARGLFSVLIGLVLLKTPWKALETPVGLQAWIRRIVMALLMMLAMILYVI